MKIAIFGKTLNPELYGAFREILDLLTDRRCKVCMHDSFARQLSTVAGFSGLVETFSNHEELKTKADVLFSIGGDGTLLDTITLIRDSEIPVLGINLGRLGFLSSVSRNEIRHAIDSVITGKYTLDQRSLLRLETKENHFLPLNFALNEVSIHNEGIPSLIRMDVFVNEKFLNSYWADGIIVSTPTGSTAYSLSCNGPIADPHTQTFIITPIASHNLTVRPIIIPDSSIIRIRVSTRSGNFLTGLDSRFESIANDSELIIQKEKFCINLIDLPGKTFFSTIREKLKWGLDARSKL